MHHTTKTYDNPRSAEGALSTKISTAKKEGRLKIDIHYPLRAAIITDPQRPEEYYLYVLRSLIPDNPEGLKHSDKPPKWFVTCRMVNPGIANTLDFQLYFVSPEIYEAIGELQCQEKSN